MSSSSPVIRNEIEPFGLPPLSARYCSTAATLQAMPPFMSTAPRPYSMPSFTSPENAPWRPGGFVAGRHHVGMAGEGDVRRLGADARIEIVDVGGAGLAEGDAVHLEAGGLQHAFEHAERAGVGGRYGRAADEVAGNGEGVGHAPLNTPPAVGQLSAHSTRADPRRPRVDRAAGRAEPVGLRSPSGYISTNPRRAMQAAAQHQRGIGSRPNAEGRATKNGTIHQPPCRGHAAA